MQVKVIRGHFINELEQELSSIIHKEFTPSLAIVFCSASQNINQLKTIFKERKIKLAGVTTAGEIYHHTVDEKSIVAVLFDLEPSFFQLHFIDNNEKKITLYDLGKEVAQLAKHQFSDSSLILFSGGLKRDGEQLVKGVKEIKLDGLNVYGALAGDDLNMKDTFVFNEDTITNDGVLALAIDNNEVDIQGTAISGWESIGTEKTITRARENVVFSIDNVPAVDIFMEYFNKPKERLQQKDMIVNELSQYPLQVLRDDGTFVLRAPLMADIDRGALIFSGGVEEGARIKFSVPPGFETIETTISEISKLKQNIPEADVLLMFSCKARHQALGPLLEEEIGGIQHIWNAPLGGFFSYGEIGSFKQNSCDFHNETVTLIVIKGK
jgi:hypothetical protein